MRTSGFCFLCVMIDEGLRTVGRSLMPALTPLIHKMLFYFYFIITIVLLAARKAHHESCLGVGATSSACGTVTRHDTSPGRGQPVVA